MNLQKEFKEKGYVIIKNYLKKDNINKIHKEIKEIAIAQIENFKYKIYSRSLKHILYMVMKKNKNLRKEVYNLIRYAHSIRKIQSDKKVFNILKKLGFTIPLCTDITTVRVDFSDEEKFLRGPHQDVGSVISENCATLWMPLTKVDEKNGSIAIYEATHKKKLRKQLFIKKNQLINNEVSLKKIKKNSKKIMRLNPGDLLIFDSFVIHESIKSSKKDNLKLNIQFIVNDANKINIKDKYYSLKNSFDRMRSKQIEKNEKN